MNVKRTPTLQTCPICKSSQPLSAVRCANCGAVLGGDPVTGQLPPAYTGRASGSAPPGGLATPTPTNTGLKPVSPPAVTGLRATQELPKVNAQSGPPPSAPHRFDWSDGEDDLFEGALPLFPLRGLLVFLAVIVFVIGAAILYARRPDLRPAVAALPTTPAPGALAPTVTFISTIGAAVDPPTMQTADAAIALTANGRSATATPPRPTAPPTNTRQPSPTPSMTPFVPVATLDVPTITPVPPSPTPSPTRGPCVQKARSGDTLSALALRCGHTSPNVIPLILEMNNLKDTASLQIGQVISIPWPTAAAATAGAGGGDGSGAGGGAGGTPDGSARLTSGGEAEPTLIPGQAWYKVRQGDSAITIAYQFNTTIKVLFDLNPEIASSFSQCDYGQPAGGEGCTVALSIGQRIRVPIPFPTATLSPTPNGSETPTPTATATFNVPYLISPGNNMLFDAADLPVLRWSASDRLGPGQVYLITLRDVTIDKVYRIPTTDMFFTLTAEYQPAGNTRHQYEWTVGIALSKGGVIPEATEFNTETRTFVWQGR